MYVYRIVQPGARTYILYIYYTIYIVFFYNQWKDYILYLQ